MPKRKPGYVRKSLPQLVVRIPEQLDETLRQVVDLLGIDMSGLVRMILTEHAAEYVERGLAARDRLRAAKEKLAGPTVPTGQRVIQHERRIDLVDPPDSSGPVG